MEFVAYNYFPPNKVEYIQGIVETLSNSGLQLSHLGKNDPPKKWKGSVTEIIELLQKGTDRTNYTFAKDSTNKLEIDFALGNFPEAVTSTISISGESKELVEKVCLHFAKYVGSYLCISGQLGLGQSQSWSFLLESENCPVSILEQVKNA
jgi:hypothetical protein